MHIPMHRCRGCWACICAAGTLKIIASILQIITQRGWESMKRRVWEIGQFLSLFQVLLILLWLYLLGYRVTASPPSLFLPFHSLPFILCLPPSSFPTSFTSTHFPSRYTIPSGGLKTPAERAIFIQHCWPSLDDIIRHVRRVREEWEVQVRSPEYVERQGSAEKITTGDEWRLTRVYVSTNGDTVWWETISSALRKDGWEVRGSADMDFGRDELVEAVEVGDEEIGWMKSWDTQGGGREAERAMKRERGWNRRKSERIVGMTVDMEVSARAEVFIGNGVRGYTLTFSLSFFRAVSQDSPIMFTALSILYAFVYSTIPLTPYLVVYVHLRRQPFPHGTWRPPLLHPVLVTTESYRSSHCFTPY
jgi:hypothetical protein